MQPADERSALPPGDQSPLSPEGKQVLSPWLDAVVREAAGTTEAFEVRAELRRGRSCSLENGAIRSFRETVESGLCLRVWQDGAAGFAGTHEFTRRAVASMVEDALEMARHNAARERVSFPFHPGQAASVVHQPVIKRDPVTAEVPELVDLLAEAHAASLEEDPDAKAQPMLASSASRTLYENSQGRRADLGFALSTVKTRVVHRSEHRNGFGSNWSAGERGLEDFPVELVRADARQATRDAVESSRARPVPAGRQRVLCDNYLSGLLAHESFGHLTEYDLVSMNWSMLNGKMGQRFAGEHVSVVDAPEKPGDPKNGVRVPYDDEATEGRTLRVLDQGRLSNWMHVRGSAREVDAAPTGNGRALNARFPPIVRMRNTYFEPGDMTREEALEELGTGLYLIRGHGGEPASDGSFMFTAYRGYQVEDGELSHPVRPTAISGNIFDFLRGVEGLTRDFEVYTTNFGGCGKWSQSFLPVGVGGPHVLVDGALVGGRSR